MGALEVPQHSLESQIDFAISQQLAVSFSSSNDGTGDIVVRITEPHKTVGRVATLQKVTRKWLADFPNEGLAYVVEETIVKHAKTVELNRVRLQSQPESNQNLTGNGNANETKS